MNFVVIDQNCYCMKRRSVSNDEHDLTQHAVYINAHANCSVTRCRVVLHFTKTLLRYSLIHTATWMVKLEPDETRQLIDGASGSGCFLAIRPSRAVSKSYSVPTRVTIAVQYKTTVYIYLHVYTTYNSFPSFNVNSPTSTRQLPRRPATRDTARSVAVHHTPWLRPIRPFP